MELLVLKRVSINNSHTEKLKGSKEKGFFLDSEYYPCLHKAIIYLHHILLYQIKYLNIFVVVVC